MRNIFSTMVLTTLAVALAACGGGGGDNAFQTPGNGSTGSATVSSVSVGASPSSIAADGSTTSTITATVLDANNAAITGATVAFSVSSGGSIAVVSGTTDANGKATATLSNLNAVAGTNLTVSAKVGTVTGTTTVGVVANQQSLSLQTDQPQIPSDASKPANLTAVLLDANNNALSGVTVHFAPTSGQLVVTQATTDANGKAKATLAAGTDPMNRSITVTATAGSASAQVIVNVTGTTLSLTGAGNLVLNSSGAYNIVLTNSAGQGINGATVSLSSAKGNTLSAPSVVTDANGRASFNVTGTVGGTDTITASALGLTQQISVSVSTQSFNFSSPTDGTQVDLGVSQAVTVTWTNNGTPVSGQTVTFATTRGTLTPSTTAITDVNGQASVSISSTSAGPAIVQATASGVSAQLNLDFVATTPSQISVQAGPATVSLQGQSTISALVRDASNNLVEGATVNFQVTTDPTNGGLSQPSAVTNAQGIAQVVYTAGNSSSGANGVTITATVNSTSVTGTTTLTVGGQTVFLSLGTGNTIDTSQGAAIYQITYSVFAVDSHGAPVINVPVSLSVLPVAYGKGVMAGCPGGTTWSPSYSSLTSDGHSYNGTKFCQNEDTDYTGNISSLDSVVSTCTNLTDGATITSHAKDYNCNNKLDPGNVAVVSPSSGSTDANGRLDVKVTYPRDHAYWTVVKLVASATVQGTQSSTTSTFVLQGAAPDYACAIGPPGPVSPYGQAIPCSDPR